MAMMTGRDPAPGEVVAVGPVPVGVQALLGFMYMGGQTLAVKAIGIATHVVLAWYLDASDFGQIALVYTVTTLAATLSNPGLETVLIQRGRRLRLWAPHAFSLAVAFGLAGTLLLVAVAPLAASVYGRPGLTALIGLVALGGLLNSLAIVPSAALSIQLRFQTLASLAFAQAAMSSVLTIGCAALGWGVYSFVIPGLVASVVMLPLRWMLSGVRVPVVFRMRKWRLLMTDTLHLSVQSAINAFVSQCDYIVLGLMYGDTVVGLYYFAFSLAGQGIRLLASSLNAVLMPSLATLREEPRRQFAAAVTAAATIGLAAFGLATAQNALLPVVLHLVYGDKWEGAVFVTQVLVLALAADSISWPFAALLYARREMRRTTAVSAAFMVVFACAVTLGAHLGAATGAAAAVLICYLVLSPSFAALAARLVAFPVADALRAYAPPYLAGAAATLPLLFLGPGAPVLATVSAIAVYATLSLVLAPQQCRAAVGRLGQLRRRP